MKICKRVMAMVVVFMLAFSCLSLGLPVSAENGTLQEINDTTGAKAENEIYRNAFVTVYAQNQPVITGEEENTGADQQDIKKLIIYISCDEENADQTTLLYDTDPGTLRFEVSEAYILDTVLVDGAQYADGTAISFDENSQEKSITVHLLKKEANEVQDSQDPENGSQDTKKDEIISDYIEENTENEIYRNDMIAVYAQNQPIWEEEENSGGEQGNYKKLMINLFCDGEGTETKTLWYDTDPGTLRFEIMEGYTLDTAFVDEQKCSEDTVVSFDENTSERVIQINLSANKPVVMQNNEDEIRLETSYSSEKPFSIQNGNKPSLFQVTTSPVQQGKLVIKLPPFFELTATPTNTENYTVRTSKGKFNSSDAEWGTVLGGVDRQVIELTYKAVDSDVFATFEMKMADSSRTTLTDAMIRAGENPDKIPLDLETYLYGADGKLLKQCIIKNTSELTDPQTMVMDNTPIDDFVWTDSSFEYNAIDVASKNKNVLYQGESDNYRVGIRGYHYPYTDVELLVPKDTNNKLITFKTADPYGRYDWYGEAEKEVIDGQVYLVRSMDHRNTDLYGNVGSILRYYDSGGSSVASPTTFICLEFLNDIEIGETISFDHPVLLRYTYKGKTITKKLYNLSEYTFQGPVTPRFSLDDGKSVLCGTEFTNGSNSVLNYDESVQFSSSTGMNRKLPIKRENMTYTIEYPFETQPKQITALKTDTLTEFDIIYTVKSNDGTTREMTVEKASPGYQFELSEGERVSKIVIQIPYLDKKENLTFSVKMQSMETDENGDAILKDKTVYLTHTLTVDGETSISKKSMVHLKPKKDLMYSYVRNYEVFLDGTGGSSWTGGEMRINSKADEKREYSVTYQNAEFTLDTDPKVMSKITGYWFEFKRSMDEPVTIYYKTNYSSGEWKTTSQNNPSATEYKVYLPLKSGEYVKEIKLNFGNLSPKEIEGPYSADAISFAPILNSKRTYYDSNGQEQDITFDTPFKMSYALTTDNLEAPAVNKDSNKSPETTYLSSVEFPLTPCYSTNAYWNCSQTTAYRGSTVEFTINKPVAGGKKYYSNYFGTYDHYYEIDDSLQFTNQYLYIEVDKGFEISSLNIANVFLERRNLSNGNRLFVYQLTAKNVLAVNDLIVRLYIRPDANTGQTVNPFKAIGISYDQYLKDYFPQYPVVEQQKSQYPYHYVTLKNENYNNKSYNHFSVEWNVAEDIQKDGFYYSFSDKQFQINEVSTAVTSLFPTLQDGLQSNPLNFKELQREQLGYVAFVGASSETAISDYTTTFELPRKDKESTIDGKTYTSQYDLLATGELKIYLNNQQVDLDEKGITITYCDEENQGLDVSTKDVNAVKKVVIHFNQLVSGEVYELRMPLKADCRTGNDVNAWNAYVINSNKTGTQAINYLPPLTYRYDCYCMTGTFGLDKNEDGIASVLNENHTLYIFNDEWKEIYKNDLSSATSHGYDVSFNGQDSEKFYIGFEIDQEKRDEYYPTLIRSVSDLPDSENNIKTLDDGRKIWYLEIRNTDLINSTSSYRYDALFVHLPEITASDVYVVRNQEETMDYTITQRVNGEITSSYAVDISLGTSSDGGQAEIIADSAVKKVKGIAEGTVPYTITVTNLQGKQVTATADIHILDKVHALLPHAGGNGQFGWVCTAVTLVGIGLGFLGWNRKRKSKV